MEKVRGVNLGNWLVLEKWMNPALFEGTDAQDEYSLPRRLPREAYEARIGTHRSEYITERDFIAIRAMGLNAVRIPVPYFIFGDFEPFAGCVGYLDKAFAWAEKYGLRILIDLHTAPDGQNGFDNGGICGVCKWAQEPEMVEFELSVLERLAKRYGRRKGLWGIEILNEPAMDGIFELGVQKRYPPADAGMAAGSRSISHEFLRGFYTEAYGRMRRYLPEEKYVVFHDGFNIGAWKDFMREDKYKGVVLDTHQYLMGAEMMGCPRTMDGYLSFIREHFAKDVAEMERYFPVICGEWCLANSLAGGAGEGRAPAAARQKEIYTALAEAQLRAWEKCSGWFYWSYKLLTDTANRPEQAGLNAWDLGQCAGLGWFPRRAG